MKTTTHIKNVSVYNNLSLNKFIQHRTKMSETTTKELSNTELMQQLTALKEQNDSLLIAMSKAKVKKIRASSCKTANNYHFSMSEFSNVIFDIVQTEKFKAHIVKNSVLELELDAEFKKEFVAFLSEMYFKNKSE